LRDATGQPIVGASWRGRSGAGRGQLRQTPGISFTIQAHVSATGRLNSARPPPS